jgi:hypothetical protein
MGRFFREATELSASSLKGTFKLLYLRLNPGPYNKLDKEVRDFEDL